MSMRRETLTFALLAALSSSAAAQFNEIEPNTSKAEATAVNGIANGGTINGTTTGTVITALSTLATSVDYFRVKTAALPLGIYRHTLAITTTGTAGHTGTLRGFTQLNGVINTTTDAAFQFNITTPTRSNTWYGFGKQEEVYYRVDGTATTTAPYVSTLSTSTVTPTAIAGTFVAGQVSVTTVGQGHASDTEIYVYDSNLNPVPFGHNDGLSTTSAALSTVTVPLGAGTYYVAVSNYNTSNNQSDLNPTEFWDDDALLDFPDAMACNSTTTALNVSYAVSDGVTTTPVSATKANAFDIVWGTFTVVGTLPPPANDNCAGAAPLGSTALAFLGGATHDGAATCDTGGGASRDVWYSFTDPNGSGGSLTLNTCGTTGVDTVLSVHSSCGGAELACSDDCGGAPCGGPTSCLSLTLSPSQTVLIRVSDKGLGGGDYVFLTRGFTPNPPVNDSCTSPITLAGPGLYGIDNSQATTGTEGQAEPLCLFFTGTAIPKDLWYTYTPTTNGTVEVSTCGLILTGPSSDSKIAIYSGTGCPVSGSAIACNDDAGNGAGSPTTCAAAGFNSTIQFPATCGVSNTIQIGMYYASTSSILGQFSVTETGGSTCASPFTSFCPGDGTGTACPCGNSGAAGNGCANSLNPNGANLTASGIASIGGDTWVLSGSGVPNGPGLYFQGTAQVNAGNGVVFGDGKRCAGGTIIRLGIVTAAGNASTYPSPNPPAVNAIPISLKGLNVAGNVRNYQLWYRDSGAFCSASVFNLTNGVNMTWAP